MFSKLKKQSFILGLLAAVGLAFLLPSIGSDRTGFPANDLTKVGVFLIFLFQGLSLPTKELGRGIVQWKLHLFIQLWILLGSAVVLMGMGFLLSQFTSSGIHIGFYYLALLPTTISSAVTFTTHAGGNVSAAIFNTTLSNIIGVFWVPIVCLYLFSAGGSLSEGFVFEMLLKLSKLILLPMIIGQALRPALKNARGFQLIKPYFKTVSNFIILYIVYVAFCRSISSNSLRDVSSIDLVLLIIFAVLSVLLVSYLVFRSAVSIFSNKEDIIAGFFCGSQKTLAAGAPIAAALFTSANFDQINLGVLIIPLLCYHPAQLFLAGITSPLIRKLKL